MDLWGFIRMGDLTIVPCRYRTPENHFCYHYFCMDLDESVRGQIEKNLAAAGVKEKSKLHVPLEETDLKILQKAQISCGIQRP